MIGGMTTDSFDEWIAERYERLWPELFDPAVIDPAVDFLAALAGGGRALELGIGTGRIALPLHERGVPVHGIERSHAMLSQLRRHATPADIDVTVGDFATARTDGEFALAYLVRNTITNLTTQDDQVQCFQNVASQLAPGGCFVIENYIPQLRPGQTVHVFTATPTHLGFEQYDVAAQIAYSHHYWVIDGELRMSSTPHRYLWPSELDLMAQLAGMTLRERWGGWYREPFTAESPMHISVWETPPRSSAVDPADRKRSSQSGCGRPAFPSPPRRSAK